MKRAPIIALALVVVLTLGACGRGAPTGAPASGPTTVVAEGAAGPTAAQSPAENTEAAGPASSDRQTVCLS